MPSPTVRRVTCKLLKKNPFCHFHFYPRHFTLIFIVLQVTRVKKTHVTRYNRN